MISRLIVLFAAVFALRRGLRLLLGGVVRLVGLFAVNVGEDEIEDVRVPAGGAALEALLDVL